MQGRSREDKYRLYVGKFYILKLNTYWKGELCVAEAASCRLWGFIKFTSSRTCSQGERDLLLNDILGQETVYYPRKYIVTDAENL